MKSVVVGSADVGKTCLVLVFQDNQFPTSKTPKVLDVIGVNVILDKAFERVDVWDTDSDDDFEELRSMLYKETNIFIVCFSVNNRNSFEDVWEKWYAEVRRRMPSAPMLLVGTKSDLRFLKSQDKRACVSIMEAVNLAKKIGASAYAECSAKSLTNTNSVLRQLVKFGRPIWSIPATTNQLDLDDFPPATIGMQPVLIPTFINDEIEPFHLEKLSEKLIRKVFGFFSPVELALCCQLNKSLGIIANSRALWELHCQQIDPSFSLSEVTEHPKAVYQLMTYSWINDFTTEPSPPPNL